MHRPDNTGGLRKKLKTLSDGKVDKITGKGLSKNDYSDAEKAALASASTSISQLSDNGNITGFVVLAQAEYDALTPDANTVYIIQGV